MLKIHNSLSGKKERFEPLEAGKVRMYVCGITVYDYLHLGHARMLMKSSILAGRRPGMTRFSSITGRNWR